MRAGQDPALFDQLTPRSINAILKGVAQRQEDQARARRADIFALAALITQGHHNPRRFPKFESFVGKPSRKHSGKGSQARLRAWLQSLPRTPDT